MSSVAPSAPPASASPFARALSRARGVASLFNAPGSGYRAMVREISTDWVDVFVDSVIGGHVVHAAVVTVYPGPDGAAPSVSVNGPWASGVEARLAPRKAGAL